MERPLDPAVEVFADIKGISRRAAALFQEVLASAVSARRWGAVVLSGGTTPRFLYNLLAAEYRDVIPWESLHFFWGDERCVPPDRDDSNYRMAWEALLSRVPVPRSNIHRIRGELPPGDAARACEDGIGDIFRTASPVFDFVLLGMGSDGHTASLFPSSTALLEETRLAVPVYVEHPGSWRVTLTLPVLNNARHIVFLVSGKAKADVFSRIHSRGERGPHLPASLVTPLHGRLTWLADQDAATQILN